MENNPEKTDKMKEFEETTGKNALWHGKITDAYKKWKNGKINYNQNKDRISLYVPEGKKDEWKKIAKEYNMTLSKLVRNALKFYTNYRSKIPGDNLDLLSSLSYELKIPLTSIKGNIQIIMDGYSESFENNINSKLSNILAQCNVLEQKIINFLDNDIEKKDIKSKLEENYDLLIIEDDRDTLNLLVDYFKTKGVSCRGVLDGTSGLEALSTNKPKVILLDILLPDMNGYEICKKINLNYENLPIYFLTAIPSYEVEENIKDLNVKGIIFKPFDINDFNKILNYF